MNRREALAALGAGAAASLAGCGSLLSCGPGDDAVEDIAANPEEHVDGGSVDVRGEVQSVSDTGVTMVVDDGTGTAELVAPTGYVYDSEFVDEGDCHSDEGRVRPEEEWQDSPADVRIRAALPDP